MACYISTGRKEDCCGCRACAQSCPRNCITIQADREGFAYPVVDETLCIKCGKCERVCPLNEENKEYIHNHEDAESYGGYMLDDATRAASTSGGGFTAVTEAFCDKNYVIFGAEIDGEFNVFHSCVENKADIVKFRKSKYLQSNIGKCYAEAKKYLDEGKKVLFSGTPCQIAGLYSFLGGDRENLLTVDLVCHGVPSNKWFYKEVDFLEKKYKSKISEVQFRNKDNNHWDNGSMVWVLETGKEIRQISEPFFKAWLTGLNSRPVCYECQYASMNRVSDITLADLWGVHHFAPELYGKNGGTSLFILNTKKGKDIFGKAESLLKSEKINLYEAAKHNLNLTAPMHRNPKRDEFISSIEKNDYSQVVKTYLPKPDYKFIILNKIGSRKFKTFLGRVYKLLLRKDK